MTHTFGPFTLDPATGTLTRDGTPIPLGHRASLLLQCLLNAQGKPVTKSALLDTAWPGQVVEEGNLTVQISALRKAIGDDLILTVPRVGYRLVAPHAELPVITELPLIAVMPFQNLSGDPSQDYFADGVVEDISTALSRFKSFAVISRNSSFAYKGRNVDTRQVAADLGVRYLLQGSLRRAGNQLRIVAQLVDGITGTQLWAETFDGAEGQIFAFQDRITESVASVIEPQIRAAEIQRFGRDNTGSLAAYDLYLRARSAYEAASKESVTTARGLIDQALVLEPENAVYLSLTTHVRQLELGFGWKVPSAELLDELIAIAMKAVSRANGDAEIMARCAIALVHIHHDYDWVLTLARSALATNPNSVWTIRHTAITELHCGSVTRAIELLERAMALSPRDPARHVTLCGLAHCHMVTGQFEQALDRANQALAASTTYDPTWWMLIAANAQLGRIETAKGQLAQFAALSPTVTIASIRAGQPKFDPSRIDPILDGLRLAALPES